jgi:hypothetical protein
MKATHVLFVDALVNLVLGIPLMIAPISTARLLGLPVPMVSFYASLLGAVLTGIGIALLLECVGNRQITGLGIAGAVSINICGAGALAIWLVRGGLEIPFRGHVFLWAVVVVVLGLGAVEVLAQVSRKKFSAHPS